eukprot:1760314-Rhodomonas_salina.3
MGWFPSTFVRKWKPPAAPAAPAVHAAPAAPAAHAAPPALPLNADNAPRLDNPELLHASPRTLAATLITMSEEDSEKVLQLLSDQRRSDVMKGIDQLAKDHGLAESTSRRSVSDEPFHGQNGFAPVNQ